MADEEEMVEVEVVEALFALTEAGDTELLARLLDENPEVLEEQHEDTGATPLISGAQHGHVGVVCLCLERGARVEARDRMSLTALQHAAIGGHTEVALRLLRAGADADTWDTFFLTSPLLQAASRGHAGVMFALLPYLTPSALHRTDMSGHTALWLACSQGHAQAVLLLLQAGAQWLRASAAPRQTPREVAVANGHSLCAAIIDWWEGELHRAYVLHKARTLHDASSAHLAKTQGLTTTLTLPACLSHRAAAGKELPCVTVEGQEGGKRGREEAEQGEGEEERRAMAGFVLHDLPSHLYVELQHGMRMG